jgi:hypothetical protein
LSGSKVLRVLLPDFRSVSIDLSDDTPPINSVKQLESRVRAMEGARQQWDNVAALADLDTSMSVVDALHLWEKLRAIPGGVLLRYQNGGNSADRLRTLYLAELSFEDFARLLACQSEV